MSRLYDAYADTYDYARCRVYRGDLSGEIFIQLPWPNIEPVALYDMRQAEELRDRLTAFLEAEYASIDK